MAVSLRGTNCCGMRELDEIGGGNPPRTAEESLRELAKIVPKTYDYSVAPPRQYHYIDFALIVFSGVVKRARLDHSSNRSDDYGAAFAKLVEKKGLGKVVAGEPGQNPRTTNTIQAWVWTVDQKALKKYCEEVDAEEEARKRDESRRTEGDRSRAGGGANPAEGTIGGITRSREAQLSSARCGLFGFGEPGEIFRAVYGRQLGWNDGGNPFRDYVGGQNPQPGGRPAADAEAPDRPEPGGATREG